MARARWSVSAAFVGVSALAGSSIITHARRDAARQSIRLGSLMGHYASRQPRDLPGQLQLSRPSHGLGQLVGLATRMCRRNCRCAPRAAAAKKLRCKVVYVATESRIPSDQGPSGHGPWLSECAVAHRTLSCDKSGVPRIRWTAFSIRITAEADSDVHEAKHRASPFGV